MNYDWLEFVNKIKYAADIEDVISPYLDLKRAGRNLTGLCPFHLEKTPSFVVYSESQSFYCFGCGTGGDTITFIMKQENLEYTEALKYLAQKYNIPFPEKGEDNRNAKLKQRILAANVEAARFFNKMLYSEHGKKGLEYLLNRGISQKSITVFGLGFAPDSWDSLKNYLFTKNFTMEELTAANLISRSQKGTYYDQFRNRIIFPIIDLRKNVIAFGGRVLDDSRPKYLNSSDTLAFKKSNNLFSLNFAKNINSKAIILAEGYMDVIAIWQAGFQGVVAALGTAFTAEQARLLSKYTDEVIIAYDSDAAGQLATSKASSLLSQAGLDTKVLVLNDAKDPDEYIKKFGAERFSLLLDASKDVFSHKIANLKRIYDISSIEGKTKYIHECVKMLTECTDAIEREVYAAKIAEDTQTSKSVILKSTTDLIDKNNKSKKYKDRREMLSGKEFYTDRTSPEKSDNLKQATAEENLLWFIMKNPDCFSEISTKITTDDFITSWGKRVFTVISDIMRTDAAYDKLELTLLSGTLNETDLSKLAGILAKKSGMNNMKIQLNDYIKILLENKEKKSDDDLSKMSPEEIQKYIMQKRGNQSGQ